MRLKGTMIVLDESIQLKRHDAQQTKAGIESAKNAVVRRILTGKPTTQGPHDLRGQMRRSGSETAGTSTHFRSTFCRMAGSGTNKL